MHSFVASKQVFVSWRPLTSPPTPTPGVEAPFRSLPAHAVFGTPLEVTLPTPLPQGKTTVIKLHYATSSNASACQWLPPEQTAGRRHPYLFTQSQAIHARYVGRLRVEMDGEPPTHMQYQYHSQVHLPLPGRAGREDDVRRQDPRPRVGHGPHERAQVRGKDGVPFCLPLSGRLTPCFDSIDAVAERRQEGKEFVDGSGRRTFVWEQPVSMPSYLVALAVGELESREISPR